MAALGVGYAGCSYSLAQAARTTDPAGAYQVAPRDPQVAALYAQSLSRAEASPADRSRADMIARQALRGDATVVAAASALGINAQARGDVAAARRLFAYSEALSRRDMQTQLWAIEDSVARDDVPGALMHYDVALRTSPRAATLLFPILASAMTDDAIRAELVRTLVRGTSWTSHFINFAAQQGADPKATVALFTALERAHIPLSAEARAALVNRLIGKQLYHDAWAYYASGHPGANPAASRDPEFQGETARASLFDWTPVETAGITASLQGGFHFAAAPSVGGPMVQQIQLLPPGDYLLQGRSREIDQAPDARPYWLLQCFKGRELGRVTLPNSAEANGVFAGRFTVPADCPVQVLSLEAAPSGSIAGLVGAVERAELRRQ